MTLIFIFTFQYMKFWTKSLSMVGKILLAKKQKTLLKFLKKFNFFQNHYRGATVEELFAYIFGIYKKFGGNNPSILTPYDSAAVAT